MWITRPQLYATHRRHTVSANCVTLFIFEGFSQQALADASTPFAAAERALGSIAANTRTARFASHIEPARACTRDGHGTVAIALDDARHRGCLPLCGL
jgi:hypothetical protein